MLFCNFLSGLLDSVSVCLPVSGVCWKGLADLTTQHLTILPLSSMGFSLSHLLCDFDWMTIFGMPGPLQDQLILL